MTRDAQVVVEPRARLGQRTWETDGAVSPPNTATPHALTAAKRFFKDHPEVKVVILQYVDMAGIVRHKLVPPQTVLHVLKPGNYMSCSPLHMTISTTGQILEKLFVHYVARGKGYIDALTLRLALHDSAGLGNSAIAVAEYDWADLDARMNLRNVVARAERDHGLSFQVGFEIEFVLLEQESLEPVDMGVAGVGHSCRSRVWGALNEMTTALAEGGVYVEGAFKEYGATQFEIALPPYPPVESVDVMVYAREVIKNVAAKHGMTATTFPVPHAVEPKNGSQKNGLHVHISATPTSDNSSWDADKAMSGILSHIPELMAISMPTIDSYERVGVGRQLAGGLLGWGFNHRDMPLRQVTRNHWEVRTVDGCANPYTVVASLIAAATDPKPLTIGNADKFTLMIPEVERRSLGLTEPLPGSLEEALEVLEKNKTWVESALGEYYTDIYVALKKEEINLWQSMEVDARRLMLTTFY